MNSHAGSSDDFYSDPDVECGISNQHEKVVTFSGSTKHAAPRGSSGNGQTNSEEIGNSKSDINTLFYISGFVIGWFTWIFGLPLGLLSGRGAHAIALRKGLCVGATAVTIPFAVIIGLFVFCLKRWNNFVDKFSVFR